MTNYTIRLATLADVSIISHHRQAMFMEMGVNGDHETATVRFTEWLEAALPNQAYFGWLIEIESGEVVAGGGVSLLPRPPSPKMKITIGLLYTMFIPNRITGGVAWLTGLWRQFTPGAGCGG